MAHHREGADVTGGDLAQMGPLALCVVVILREAVAAWKWTKEINRKSEVEALVGELRPTLEKIHTALATGQMTIEQLAGEVRERSTDTEKMWRELYEGLVQRHDDHLEREQGRLSALVARSAEALEATETVMSLVCDKMEDSP